MYRYNFLKLSKTYYFSLNIAVHDYQIFVCSDKNVWYELRLICGELLESKMKTTTSQRRVVVYANNVCATLLSIYFFILTLQFELYTVCKLAFSKNILLVTCKLNYSKHIVLNTIKVFHASSN